FFSSRRRHTRSKRDWSSDVCSSDLTAELVAQHAEGTRCVAEGAGDLVGGVAFDEEGAQGFVLALAGMGGLGEESSDFCYVFRYRSEERRVGKEGGWEDRRDRQMD